MTPAKPAATASTSLTPPFVAGMIIPTGVGASIGGFGGDAMPYLNLLASVCDVLITHPNVANAAMFQKLPDNAMYVEGYGLDQFMQGRWALRPVRANRLGVVFDAGMDEDMLTLHLNTLNAVQTVYGVDFAGYTLTEEPVAVSCELTETGCSSGRLSNPEGILAACRRLQADGADAIALCVQLPDAPEAVEAAYKEGGGVDPIGGIEAILSHLVVSELGIPCAHAPVFPWDKARPVTDAIVDPRAAAEFITPTFLPCVLTGLQRAPRFIQPPQPIQPGDVSLDDLDALVVPGDALGGLPVLAAMQAGIPVLAVRGNQTVLDVSPACLEGADIRPVRSYEEAAGMLQMMRLGLRAETQAVAEIRTASAVSAV